LYIAVACCIEIDQIATFGTADLISKRKVNTLILVHRKQLAEQGLERLRIFLDLKYVFKKIKRL